jgi:hypothetical protein
MESNFVIPTESTLTEPPRPRVRGPSRWRHPTREQCVSELGWLYASVKAHRLEPDAASKMGNLLNLILRALDDSELEQRVDEALARVTQRAGGASLRRTG